MASNSAMATKMMLACLYFLFLAAYAFAQTITATDANGNTVIEVVTINPQLGVPTTQTVQTLAAGTSIASPTATPTTALIATTQAPEGQQGPVGAPAPINGPVSTYVYTYTTTDAAGTNLPVLMLAAYSRFLVGGFTAIVDTYTATAPASAAFTPTGTGTVLNFSAYLSMIGTNTVAPDFSASLHLPVPRSLWIGTTVVALGLAGGFAFVFA
ncbi:hypothetical protein BDY19DRAFT_973898 [Irpex rosettiformis]|uniref:Uncharacterized protein n=1 Tax=Irpex rosettiformis TaxID=378272 RepID=A0ACB8TQ29_9APHY|nr:hypothetical protein BDY19DRAFT_973898 [Irpex rosettiformis]